MSRLCSVVRPAAAGRRSTLTRPVLPAGVLAGLGVLAALVTVATPATAGKILDCRFNNEPLDTLIGEGGPLAGQPITRGGAPAYVRAAPLATPSLEIGDDSGTTAESARFEFVNDWAASTGTLTISMNLWFDSIDSYALYVREQQNSAVRFLNLIFNVSGNVLYGDIDTAGNVAVGTYTAGQLLPLTITFDLDTATYDVELDGVMLRTSESMGGVPQGIGSISLGTLHDANFDGLLYVDDLLVEASDAPTPVETESWAGIKAIWRDR